MERVAILAELQRHCASLAREHYEIFDEYPRDFPYSTDADFIKIFGVILLDGSDHSLEVAKSNFLFLLYNVERVLNACCVDRAKTGNKYFSQYVREVAPSIGDNPELHEAIRAAIVSERFDELASRWSNAIHQIIRLRERIASSRDPFSEGTLVTINEIFHQFRMIRTGYHSVNGEMAKYMGIRRKYLSDTRRNNIALASLAWAIVTGVFGTIWLLKAYIARGMDTVWEYLGF